MDFAKSLRTRRERIGATREQLAVRADVSASTIFKIEAGERGADAITGKVRNKLLRALSDLEAEAKQFATEFQAERFDLARAGNGFRVRPPEDVPQDAIPLMNKCPAGEPEDFDDMSYPPGVEAVEWLPRERVPKHIPAEAYTVCGDSMLPDYMPGDIVIVAPINPRDGQDCFVRLAEDAPRHAGKCTFKRVYFEGETINLTPLNANDRNKTISVAREHVAQILPAIAMRRELLKR